MTDATPRYEVGGADTGATLDPRVDGSLVRFADVEAALRDTTLLSWLLPLVDGKGLSDIESTRRMTALASGMRSGLTGRDLVTWAVARCPS